MSVPPVWLTWHAFKWGVRAEDWTRRTPPVRFPSFTDIVLNWQVVIIQPQKWGWSWFITTWSQMIRYVVSKLFIQLTWFFNRVWGMIVPFLISWITLHSYFEINATWVESRNQQSYDWLSADYVIALKIWICREASQHAVGLTDSWTISLSLSVFQHCYWSYRVQHCSLLIFPLFPYFSCYIISFTSECS